MKALLVWRGRSDCSPNSLNARMYGMRCCRMVQTMFGRNVDSCCGMEVRPSQLVSIWPRDIFDHEAVTHSDISVPLITSHRLLSTRRSKWRCYWGLFSLVSHVYRRGHCRNICLLDGFRRKSWTAAGSDTQVHRPHFELIVLGLRLLLNSEGMRRTSFIRGASPKVMLAWNEHTRSTNQSHMDTIVRFCHHFGLCNEIPM